jgi:choline dehydrogenase-like flavoprotein
MIPNPDTYCEIDPVVVDKWGIPVLRFHFKWSDYELKMAKDMQDTFRSIVEAAGGTVVDSARRQDAGAKTAGNQPQEQLPYGISEGGEIIHELGTVRMGDDPKTSALNKNCQAHDVKNLFVGDGACFVTGPDKNPTLTITALSWRTSEYILDQAKKGEI